MDKLKRILALAGVILLAALYLITLVLALIDSPQARQWLYAALGATVVIPTLLYVYLWIYNMRRK